MDIRRMFRGRSGRFGAAALILCASVLAILLWGRLKLVTGVPRTAMAEPHGPRVSQRTPRSRPAPGRDSRTAPGAQTPSAFVGD